MVAIFSGAGVGFERGSGSVLGSAGTIGSAALGRNGEQVHVNAANGNLLIGQRDEFLVGLGPDVAIGRTYNSLGDLSDDNGDNWRQSTDRRVYGLTGTYGTAGSTVKRVSGDGSPITYGWDQTWNNNAGAYVASSGAGAWDSLTQASNVWTWTDGDTQATEKYAAAVGLTLGTTAWRLIQVSDTDLNKLTLTYLAGTDKLDKVTTQDLAYTQYVWSGNNISQVITGYTDLATSTAKTLTRTSYTYSGNRLSSVTVDLTPGNTADAATYTTNYGYESYVVGGLTYYRVNLITQTDGSSLAIAYNSQGKVQTLTQTAAAGVTRVTTMTYGTGFTTVTDPTGQITRLDYNSDGSLRQITSPPAQVGATAQMVQFEYNAYGDLIAQAKGDANLLPNPLLLTNTAGWDVVNATRVAGSAADPLPYYFQHAGGAGNGAYTMAALVPVPAETTLYLSVQAKPAVAGQQVSAGVMWYDANGVYISGNIANGWPADTTKFTTYEVQAVRPANAVFYYAYAQCVGGQWGGLRLAATPTSVPGNYETTTYTYDTRGNVTQSSDGLGNTVVRSYGAENELLRETRYGSNAASADAQHTTRFAYDAENHLRYEVSAEGKVTEFRYKATGALEYTIEYPEHFYDVSALAATATLTEAQLDAWRNAIADRSSTMITYNLYDGRGNAAQTTRYGVATAAGAASTAEGFSRTTFVYDQAGQLLSRYAEGQSTEYFVYDGMGRLIASTDVNGGTTRILFNDSAAQTVVYLASGLIRTSTYNKAGDLIAFTESSKPNTLANSFLASGTEGWTLTNAARVAGAPGDPFPYYFQSVSNASNGYAETPLTTAPVGSTFDLSWTAKAGTAGQQFKIGVMWVDANGIFLKEDYFNVWPTDTTSFITYSYQVDKPANAASYQIYTIGTPGASAKWGGVQFSPSNHVPNALLLNGTTGWTLSNAVRVAGAAGDPLPYYFQNVSTASNGSADQAVTAVPEGTAFDLSYTAKVGAAGQQIKIGVMWMDANNNFLKEDYFNEWPANTSSFVTYNYKLTRPRNAAYYQIYTIGTPGATVKWGGVRLAPERDGATSTSVSVYKYDKLGRLRMETDATGRNLYHVYDKVGRKIADVNHLGQLIEYRYDTTDRLVATVRYAGVLTAAQLTTLANPDSNVDMSTLRPAANGGDLWTWQVYDRKGRLIEAIDGDGGVTAYAYDRSDRLVKTTAYLTKLATAQLAAFKTILPTTPILPATHANDSVARNFYDKDGRLIGVLDGEGYLSRTTYDTAGRKVEALAFANPTSTTYRVSGTFNQLLGSVASSPTNDRVVRFVHDGRGLLRYEVDGLDQVVEYLYDSASQVTTTIRYNGSIAATSDYTYDSIKAAVAASGLGGNGGTRKSWAIYDSAGRIAYSIDAENAVTGFSYDSTGRITRTTAYGTKRTTTSLPTLATMDSWAAGQAASTANRVTHAYHGDRPGELLYSVEIATDDGKGYVTRFSYDQVGRKTGETRWDNVIVMADNPSLATVEARANASGTSVGTSFAYDAAGRLAWSYDGEGNARAFAYNANGTLLSETEAAGTADASETRFEYDSAGRLIKRTRAYGAGTDEAAVQYGYDAFGSVVTVTDPLGHVTYQYYDRLGRQVMSRDAEDYVTETAFNAFGDAVTVTRRHNRTTSAVSTTVKPSVTADSANDSKSVHYFDKIGREKVTRDAEGFVTETAYTAFGQAANVKRRYNRASNAADPNVLPTVAAHGNDATTAFDYDRRGRLTRTTDAEGKDETYVLTTFGERQKVRNKLGWGKLATDPTFDAYAVVNAYDRRGLLVSESLPTASVRSDGTTQASAVVNRFEYDSRGNRTRTIEASGLTEERITTFVYDKADRLTAKQHAAVGVLSQADHRTLTTETPVETFEYDRRGNILEATDANGARTLFYYDKLDRKIRELAQNGATTGTFSTYQYDDSGNLEISRVYGTAKALPAGVWTSLPAAPTGEYRETRHDYDALNRRTATHLTGMSATGVAGLRTGAWSTATSTYSTASGATLTTSLEYDSRGNVVKTTDAAGSVTWAWYDRTNGRTAQLDGEKYLTKWTLDSEGNALSERCFAAAFTGTPVLGAAPAPATGTNDRVTDFVYDKNGRRLSETRTGVVAYTVGGDGALTAAATSAAILYTYNALGQLLSKQEAVGDVTNYGYDNAGRLTTETRAQYIDSSNGAVRPTLRYHYDGLGNLTLTRQGYETPAAGDRFTRYSYGAGGRLATMTDANGAVYSYAYDAAGNRLKESYSRLKADGTSSDDSLLYTRDIAGRVTAQRLATWNGAAWVDGDSQNTAYNQYGEVSQRGLNGLWQEQFAYDLAGRLWRSNSGDGVWRYFISDAAGRQTAAIESEGTDLSNKTIDEVLAITGANPGGSYVDGVNSTITVFDKRGLATETRLPERQLSAAGLADLVVARTYNAFGEMLSETDPRNSSWITNYSYNAMGRVTKKESPAVAWTSEAGIVDPGDRPTETYYYDLSGRLIGTRDANQSHGAASELAGSKTTRQLLAGTGHGGSEALVAKEFHPDGGMLETRYDVFGDARILIDEVGRLETRSYDSLGRLTAQAHKGGLLTDYYSYDLLGQRIKHWNSFLTGSVETTDYDMQGRVTRTVAFGGDTTTTGYVWSSTLATSGMGTFGGWTETTTYANSKTLIEKSDMFGRTVSKTDLGGHVFSWTFDRAGRTATQAVGGETTTYGFLNTGLVGSISTDASNYANYTYDATGNRLSEVTVRGAVTVQNATASYDSAGRMTSWDEAGGATPQASVDFEYDLGGNVRRKSSTYWGLNANGAATYQGTTNHYYRYDAMNRMTTERGTLSGGVISGGVAYAYDAAGQRITSTQTVWRTNKLYRYVAAYGPTTPRYYDEDGDMIWTDDGGGQLTYVDYGFWSSQVETYGYRGDGALQTVAIAVQDIAPIGDLGTTSPQVGALGSSLTRATFTNDAMGRLTRQQDWLDHSTGNAAYDRSMVLNAKGQADSETVSNKQGSDTYVSYITNTYGTGASYALGAVLTVTSSNWKNGYDFGDNGAKDTYTTNSYAWYDGAVQSQIVFDSESGSSTNPLYTTTFSYGASGQLTSAYVGDGRPRTITYTSLMDGQIVRRDEADGTAYNTTFNTGGDPHEVWYRYSGRELGYVGNNGSLDTDYLKSIDNRGKATPATPGPFRFGAATDTGYADFDRSLEAINSYGQGGSGGAYGVRAGDSLAGIAAQLWGDSALWYKLAEANGLSAASTLAEGQSLTVPAGVTGSGFSASTFKPYDAAEAVGDTSPTTPKPNRKSNKCGMFGQILLVVIAVAVTALTYGALTGPTTGLLGTVLAGAVSSAAGSIASQGFGVATGIQDKFSWKSVAMAAISGAVGGGVGSVMKGAMLGSQFLGDVVRGAVGSALTQGIGVAVGLQKKFDFAAVAAAGIGAGVVGAVSRHLADNGLGVRPEDISRDTVRNAAFYANQALSGAAGAIAGAAMRTLADGSDFGDNILAALPDVIGTTIGNMIADPLTARMALAKEEARVRKLAGSTVLPEDLRGTEAVTEMVREAVRNGASNKDVRAMLADPGAQDYFAGELPAAARQGESYPEAFAAADQPENLLTAKIHLAQAGGFPRDPFGDPWLQEQIHPYTFEGIVEALASGSRMAALDFSVGLPLQASEYKFGLGTFDDPAAGRILREFRLGEGPANRTMGPNSRFSRGFAASLSTRIIVTQALEEWATRRGGWSANGGRLDGFIGTFGSDAFQYATISGSAEAHVIGSFRLNGRLTGSNRIQWTATNEMSLRSYFGDRLTGKVGVHAVNNNYRPQRYGNTTQTIIWYTDKQGRIVR